MQDEDIIRLYFQRSEKAIKETELKYGKLCARVIKNFLNDNEDIKECLNDTYLGAWNSIPPSSPSSLSAYLCRIAKNLALKKYEYISAKKRNSEAVVSFEELEECITDFQSLDIRYTDSELSSFINRFLRSQKQEVRMVFIRRYWYHDSVKDICKQYRLSKSKVESMLYRTRKKLQDALQEDGYYL